MCHTVVYERKIMCKRHRWRHLNTSVCFYILYVSNTVSRALSGGERRLNPVTYIIEVANTILILEEKREGLKRHGTWTTMSKGSQNQIRHYPDPSFSYICIHRLWIKQVVDVLFCQKPSTLSFHRILSARVSAGILVHSLYYNNDLLHSFLCLYLLYDVHI